MNASEWHIQFWLFYYSLAVISTEHGLSESRQTQNYQPASSLVRQDRRWNRFLIPKKKQQIFLLLFLASTKAKEVEDSVCLVMMPGGLVLLDLSLLVVLLMLSAFLVF